MKIRELLTKINDAIRPAHVGDLPPVDVTERGGTEFSAPFNAYVGDGQDKKPE